MLMLHCITSNTYLESIENIINKPCILSVSALSSVIVLLFIHFILNLFKLSNILNTISKTINLFALTEVKIIIIDFILITMSLLILAIVSNINYDIAEICDEIYKEHEVQILQNEYEMSTKLISLTMFENPNYFKLIEYIYNQYIQYGDKIDFLEFLTLIKQQLAQPIYVENIANYLQSHKLTSLKELYHSYNISAANINQDINFLMQYNKDLSQYKDIFNLGKKLNINCRNIYNSLINTYKHVDIAKTQNDIINFINMYLQNTLFTNTFIESLLPIANSQNLLLLQYAPYFMVQNKIPSNIIDVLNTPNVHSKIYYLHQFLNIIQKPINIILS